MEQFMQAVKNYSCTDKFVPHTIKGTQNRYFNSTNNKNTLSEMYRKKIPLDINCGVKIAMEVIGGKWKTYILYELDRGARRPSLLHRLFGDASPRVINMQLKELETHGMIKKTVYPGLPPHVEYSITDDGRSLMPIIRMLEQWGNAFRPKMIHILEKAEYNR